MKRFALFLFAITSMCADTLVSGTATYNTDVIPYNSDTSFDLTLSGGAITTFDFFHGFQVGAKGNSNLNFTSSFSIQPVPAQEVNIIGVSTPFQVVLNGVTYAQGVQNPLGTVVPADNSTFAANFTLTPISGTNLLDTSTNSSAAGLFAISGTVSATINGVTTTDPFSGFANFTATNQTNVAPFGDQLLETYTFSADAPAPEPATIFGTLAGLATISVIACQRLRTPKS